MQIIDAQIHVWGSGLPGNDAHIQVTSFTPEEAISMMDGAGVNGAVIHPPSWDPDAVNMALKAVNQYPNRFSIMGAINLSDPKSVSLIPNWKQQDGMLGMRFGFLGGENQKLLHNNELNWFWEAASEYQIPIAALATDSLEKLKEVAKKYPDLSLPIDHLGGRGGNTHLKDDLSMTHIPELLSLAEIPNIVVKGTGAPGYSSGPYPFYSMHKYLKQIFESFGPHRMFWGTDITKMQCSWKDCITMFTEELPWLSDADQELVMGQAICAWWGWNREN